MELQPGIVIADRYELDCLLGKGGMGEVWSAFHTVTDKAVALKFLARRNIEKLEARERFIREARAASRVDHPNVVAIHDVLELDDGMLAMVMDRLVGETLGQRLDRRGALSLDETAQILVPVISAVGTAHTVGVVHRDLKPDNIFLREAPFDVRVLDFGIAKLMEHAASARDSDLTNTGALLGTPYYMAPEQVFGEKDLDQRADVFALGVILYECLAGERPFDGDNAGQIMKAILHSDMKPIEEHCPSLPLEVRVLIYQMLALDRSERLPDLRDAFDVLAVFTDTVSERFSAPRFSNPPRISVSPGRDSDPYAATAAQDSWEGEPRFATLNTGDDWDEALDEGVLRPGQLKPAEASEPKPPRRRRGDPALLDTGGPLSSSLTPPRRSNAAVLLAAGALLAVGVGLYAMMGQSELPPTPAASVTVAASPAPVSAASAAPPVAEPSASSVSPAASALPSASSESSSRAAPAAAPRPSPRTQRPAPAATAAPTQSALPHGIHDKVPF